MGFSPLPWFWLPFSGYLIALFLVSLPFWLASMLPTILTNLHVNPSSRTLCPLGEIFLCQQFCPRPLYVYEILIQGKLCLLWATMPLVFNQCWRAVGTNYTNLSQTLLLGQLDRSLTATCPMGAGHLSVPPGSSLGCLLESFRVPALRASKLTHSCNQTWLQFPLRWQIKKETFLITASDQVNGGSSLQTLSLLILPNVWNVHVKEFFP